MGRRGPRAKPSLTTRRRKAPVTTGARVQVTMDATKYASDLTGRVRMWDERTDEVTIDFDDGEEVVLPLRDINAVDDYSDMDPSSPVHPSQPGFYQYPIEWRDNRNEVLKFKKSGGDDHGRAVQFKTRAEGVKFYGIWRKTKTSDGLIAYAIDIYAKWDGEHYHLPTLGYLKTDPRLPRTDKEKIGDEEVEVAYSGIRELNCDICVAINKWLYFHAGGNVQTISDLKARANRPVLHFDSFDSLRECILKLSEMYNVAARSGGFRACELKGTSPHDARVVVEVNLSSQLQRQGFMVKGGLPDVPDPVFDDPDVKVTKSSKDDKPKKRRSSGPPLVGNADELTKQLREIQAKPKSERTPEEDKYARKIRAALRDMGRRGGARGKKKRK